MKKVTYKSSTDIAFVKYWGKKDEVLRLPANDSFSMILDGLDTITTVEFQDSLKSDEVIIDGRQVSKEAKRVTQHLDRVRKLAGITTFAKVVSENSFPKSTGLSSTGSAFAALSYSATIAAGLELSEKELSILSRKASGTACRCVCGGFVHWNSGESSENSFSQTVFPATHWDLRDVITVIDDQEKHISSTAGHKTAQTSVFYQLRQKSLPQKISLVKKAVKDKNFTALGELIEAEALEFHSILLTSQPPILMWQPGTIEVMKKVHQLREQGVEAYFSMNTGFNVHVLTLPENEELVAQKLSKLSSVKQLIHAKTGRKPIEINQHLF